LSRLTFARAVWALLGSAGRHGVARGRWAELRPVLAAAWSAYAAEAPAPAGRARLAPAAPLTAHAGRALRVLVATHNLNFEGAPWFIFELARHLATLPGVTVRIVSPQAGPMGAVFEQAGMPVQMLDLAAAFAAPDPAAFQAALLAATRPIDWSATDLVIANTMVSFWAVHAARQAGKTSLLYIHESAAIRRFFAPLLGLDDIALFMPETGDIFDFYRLADIFVCTSFEESFPRVLLESAAFGLPVVTTNVNGIPEMLAADEAWHTPPGDRYRLAEAIKLALAAHFAGDRSRVEKARATVLRKYHEAHSLPRHARLARAAAQHR
jgi:hypothetical protein